jgi:hydrogenase maturation protein HypF
MRLDVTGAVQGVGFRPFVHRLATSEGLAGFVRNTGDGAAIEIEGPAPAVERFLRRLDAEIAAPAAIATRAMRPAVATGADTFVIAPSEVTATGRAEVLADLVTCADCLREVLDPSDRRYRYPFTTCMHCGPRFSIIEAMPYDRERTAMRRFAMCEACAAEYADPQSRRFHAETNACPACGPRLTLRDAAGDALAEGDEALGQAVDALRGGKVVAVKGVGGFQLLADARNEAAVAALRRRKRRPRKPFAVMVRDMATARQLAVVSPAEAEALTSAAGPIVLLPAREATGIAPAVSPASPLIGLMLATTPLHHLLLRELDFPIVATSGNREGEPIVTETDAAVEQLAGIADLFLAHDRPIVRRVDDSVVRLIAGEVTVLRSARGFAPASFSHPGKGAPGVAVGGHQKAAIALDLGDRIVLGPHIGDLDTAAARAALEQSADDLAKLHRAAPQWVARDAHPDYASTRLAERLALPLRRVPHHLAHVLAGCLDSGIDGPVLGVAWDGTGYGGDGTIWGGEFLAIADGHWRRSAHLLPFALPGGEAVMREPWRSALGALVAVHGDAAFGMRELPVIAALASEETQVLRTVLSRRLNAPSTSSAGRLFDAVAALLGLCRSVTYEGEAAITVEFAAARATEAHPLDPIALVADGAGPIILDWRPMLASLLAGLAAGVPAEKLALGFHHALVGAIVAVADRIGIADLLLTGGCFQNSVLAEAAQQRLAGAGFVVHTHRRIPPNDGGLAAGQAIFARRPLEEIV